MTTNNSITHLEKYIFYLSIYKNPTKITYNYNPTFQIKVYNKDLQYFLFETELDSLIIEQILEI